MTTKTLLITGSTDGIGLATAKTLAAQGHTVLLHGRSDNKLAAAKKQVMAVNPQAKVETYAADLSLLANVRELAAEVMQHHAGLDVLINNAGVYVVPQTLTEEGLDVRFAVNTIAPYLLTHLLAPTLGAQARVVNISSAAQAPFDVGEIGKPSALPDGAVYAKSKLALTVWTRQLAKNAPSLPELVAVNPGSFLGSKMVKEAYGADGGDVQKGADILVRAALSNDFEGHSGAYFDNDVGAFSAPHPYADTPLLGSQLVAALDEICDI